VVECRVPDAPRRATSTRCTALVEHDDIVACVPKQTCSAETGEAGSDDDDAH
jgi:hypothetical protein